MQNTYQYAGEPFTVRIAEALILENFAGQTIKTEDLKRQVVQLHLDSGGKEHNPAQVRTHPVQRAVRNLKTRGLASNDRVPHATWEIYSQSNPETIPIEDNFDSTKTVGSGDATVYLYWFPAYRKLAKLQGESIWRCKIGTTNDDPHMRISSQVGTEMPEYPKIGLIIKTDTPDDIEKRIHEILKATDRHIEDAPGTEWFLTNPDAVEKIFDNLSSGQSENTNDE